jgi:hypothetical protein
MMTGTGKVQMYFLCMFAFKKNNYFGGTRRVGALSDMTGQAALKNVQVPDIWI